MGSGLPDENPFQNYYSFGIGSSRSRAQAALTLIDAFHPRISFVTKTFGLCTHTIHISRATNVNPFAYIQHSVARLNITSITTTMYLYRRPGDGTVLRVLSDFPFDRNLFSQLVSSIYESINLVVFFLSRTESFLHYCNEFE